MDATRARPQVTAAGFMLGAALLFAIMGACIKAASVRYGAGEIVFYRSAVGTLAILGATHWRGGTLRTQVPAMHFWRSASGVGALLLWTYALGGLPLATAMTLNYLSSVWMALFLIGGAVMLGVARIDGRLVAAVLAGFVGVALVLQPTIEQRQLWHGLAGLLSGVLAAMAYLQVAALSRAGETDARIVFYFCLGGMLAGAMTMAASGLTAHDGWGLLQLLAIGVLATVAQMMMTRAYAVGHALANAALQYSGIVFGFALGVIWFDEPVTATAVLGVLLIVGAGIAVTVLRQRTAPHVGQPGSAGEL